jgi:hypothetical protein
MSPLPQLDPQENAPADRTEPIDDTAGIPRADGRSARRRGRLRGWKLPITDGPFAESKEMLGG